MKLYMALQSPRSQLQAESLPSPQLAQQPFLFSLSFLIIIYISFCCSAQTRSIGLLLSLHLLSTHVTEHSLYQVKVFSPWDTLISFPSTPR